MTKDVLDLKDRALDAALEGITIADARRPDHPLIYVNKGFEILTGYRGSDVLGKNCRCLQGPETDPATVEVIRKAVAHHHPCVVEILNYHKNGSPFWNRLSITPVNDKHGVTTHFIGVQSDVTVRRKAEGALREANREMQQALDAAAQVQASLLPHRVPTHDHVNAAWRLKPCTTLAGDILNVFWLDDHRLACYVLDVVGHGVAAALLACTLSHFLSPTYGDDLIQGRTPAEIAAELNRRFPFDNDRQQFFTLLFGVLDVHERAFEYVSAGHPSLLHISSQAEVCVSPATGFPVGVVEHPNYENHRLQLQGGDRLLLYSDGIIEAGQADDRRTWGIQALCQFLQAHGRLPLPDLLDQIMAEVATRHGDAPVADDLSLLGLELV